ncbi:MAG TPA: hypothetical protein PLN18_01880 [Candidatus Colwellbacteria bacterium]|nr:hypothetical protein [Candidatus Colwellbacteria bacterium]HQA96094.1 hypothetical protein [Candidatus Colwellbacteria bacterium]
MDESKNAVERAKIIEAIGLSMAKEIEPQDPEVVILAEKWTDLMDELAYGNGLVREELKGIDHENINDFRERFGEAVPDDETLDYIRRALVD